MNTFTLITYNIHKGFSPLGKNLSIHLLKEQLHNVSPDIIFLQEVQGLNSKKNIKHFDWPIEPQHEFLADELFDSAYGMNCIYDHGHHGNAILSKHKILEGKNQNITHLPFEKRGILHTKIDVNGIRIHCACVHLSLLGVSRKKQLGMLVSSITKFVPENEPLIIAGDFNDWNNQSEFFLKNNLNMTEVFSDKHGKLAKTFPARLPILKLDRIYTRGVDILDVSVLKGGEWGKISDHSPIKCVFSLTK